MSDLLVLMVAGLLVALLSLFVNLRSPNSPTLRFISFFMLLAGLLYAAVMLGLLTAEVL